MSSLRHVEAWIDERFAALATQHGTPGAALLPRRRRDGGRQYTPDRKAVDPLDKAWRVGGTSVSNQDEAGWGIGLVGLAVAGEVDDIAAADGAEGGGRVRPTDRCRGFFSDMADSSLPSSAMPGRIG